MQKTQETGTASQRPGVLVRLSESSLTLASADADVRGRSVVDQNGDDVGEVDDLMVDEDEARVRFLRVKSGGFLGMGAHTLLIPVDAVTRVTAHTVTVNQTRERIAGAPRYDPKLEEQGDYYTGLYGYYGVPPFWMPGYAYPTYPYYGAAPAV